MITAIALSPKNQAPIFRYVLCCRVATALTTPHIYVPVSASVANTAELIHDSLDQFESLVELYLSKKFDAEAARVRTDEVLRRMP